MKLRTGHCHCGYVEYEVSADEIACYACHCTDCQAQSGSAFSMSMIVPLPAIKVTSGQCSKHVVKKPSGKTEHHRCRKCGTRLWSVGSRAPELAFLKPGTLDDTSTVAPVAHFWTKSAQPWVRFDGEVETYETQPEDPAELLRLWQARR